MFKRIFDALDPLTDPVITPDSIQYQNDRSKGET